MNEFEDKTLKNVNDTTNDCFDRAFACDALSEDYVKLVDKGNQGAKIMLENKKMDIEREIELKKIELELKKLDLEQLKINEDKSLKNPKFWVETVIGPVAVTGFSFMCWMTAAVESVKFEKTDLSSLSVTKGVFRYVTDGLTSMMRRGGR